MQPFLRPFRFLRVGGRKIFEGKADENEEGEDKDEQEQELGSGPRDEELDRKKSTDI